MGTGTKKKEIGNFNYQRRDHSFFSASSQIVTNRDGAGPGEIPVTLRAQK